MRLLLTCHLLPANLTWGQVLNIFSYNGPQKSLRRSGRLLYKFCPCHYQYHCLTSFIIIVAIFSIVVAVYCFSFQLSDSQTPQALIGIILFDADLSVYGVEGGGIWVAGCSAPLVFHSSVGGGAFKG